MSAGRPAFEATPAQRIAVTAAVACGCRLETVARHLGLDRKTLGKHFKREIREAKGDALSMVARTLFNSAMNGNTVAAIFWLKCQGGWKETSVNQLTGPNGQPLNNPMVVINNGQPIDTAESAMAAYQLMMGNPSLDVGMIRFASPPALGPPLVTTDAPEPHDDDAPHPSGAQPLGLPTDPLAGSGLPDAPWCEPGATDNVIRVADWPPK